MATDAAGDAFEAPETMKAVIAVESRCAVVDRPVPVPSERQVLIHVKATAVNRADTLQRMGKYTPPPGTTDILGLEVAGVVVAKGPGCVLRVPLGSHVMSLLSGGGYAEYVAVDERLVMRKPDSLDLVTAGGIPEVWLTAYQLIHFIAGVKPGDVVLVHAAGSGVGTAATQLLVGHGATVIAVAGTQEKLDLALSLGASHAFNYKVEPFAPKVLAATGGKGFNVVLDCVGASHWAQNVECAAMDARWVLYGLMGGATPEGPVLLNILRKRIRLEGTTLRARSEDYKIALSNELAAHATPKFLSGEYRPIIGRTFDGLESLQDAHDFMEANKTLGKLVVKVAP